MVVVPQALPEFPSLIKTFDSSFLAACEPSKFGEKPGSGLRPTWKWPSTNSASCLFRNLKRAPEKRKVPRPSHKKSVHKSSLASKQFIGGT
jgi:hypothetical protein